MRYEDISENPSKFLAMTGYTVEEFEALLPHFGCRYEEKLKTHTLTGKKRVKRKHSEYENSPLPRVGDNILFIPVYSKQGMTQEAHASLFGMYQSDADKRIHFLHNIPNQTLKDLGELPARDPDSSNPEKEESDVFLHDGTERAIVRPKNNDDRKQYHSGKKKQHTIKNILIINVLCRIIFLSRTCEGKKHDKKAADEAGYGFPEGSHVYQDTGFQGFEPGKAVIFQPKKKPRGGELTADEKENNRVISEVRIRIEHAISGVKRYRIVKDKIRNRLKGFRDQVMETCCGLHNFRLKFRAWIPVTI